MLDMFGPKEDSKSHVYSRSKRAKIIYIMEKLTHVLVLDMQPLPYCASKLEFGFFLSFGS